MSEAATVVVRQDDQIGGLLQTIKIPQKELHRVTAYIGYPSTETYHLSRVLLVESPLSLYLSISRHTMALTGSRLSLDALTIEQLQATIEPFRLSSSYRFQNWARSVSCHPLAVYAVETEEQIRCLIELAKREGKELRAFGSGHSPSDLPCTDGYMLSMDKMNQVLHVDKERSRMTFQAGIKIQRINVLAREQGLAISSLGSIAEQAIGGAISTATHGVGLGYTGLSGMVTALSIIKADTTIVTCSAEENSDLFYASLCGLGCTGIITQVTMQLEPDFKLKEEMFAMTFGDFVNSLETQNEGGFNGLLGSAEHVRCWYFPHNDYIKVSRLNRTKEPINSPPTFIERWFNQCIIANYVFKCGLLLGKFFPSILPYHEQLLWHLSHNPHRLSAHQSPDCKFRWKRLGDPIYSVARSNEMFNYDCGPRQYTYEGCVPVERLEDTLLALQAWFRSEAKDPNGVRHHFPIEVRPVGKDEVWLSPGYQRNVVYIGIQIYKPFNIALPHEELFRKFEAILDKHDGRPHWAKAHTYTPQSLERIYPKFKDFLRLREELDPSRLFVNEYLRRTLFGINVGLRSYTTN